MHFINDLPNGNIYLITNSAGGGHIEASNCIKKQIFEERPDIHIIEKDILKLHGKKSGERSAQVWSAAQRKELISFINTIDKIKILGDAVLFPSSIAILVKEFASNNIIHVIDTQPLNTWAITSAVLALNVLRKNNGLSPIKITRVLTELPTTKTSNFFSTHRYLTPSQKSIFKLITSPPLLQKNQSEEDFWQRNCHLSLTHGQVEYDHFPIRKAFCDIQNTPLIRSCILRLKINSTDELKYITNIPLPTSAKITPLDN